MPLDEGWSEFDEAAYRRWLAQWFYNTGVMYDPDDPFYDYREAFKKGIAPEWQREHGDYRWPDTFKNQNYVPGFYIEHTPMNEMPSPYYQWKKQDEAPDYTAMAEKLGSGYG